MLAKSKDDLNREDKERGQTITSLASSISSVMSLADGYPSGYLDGSSSNLTSGVLTNAVPGGEQGTDRDDDVGVGDDDDYDDDYGSGSAEGRPGAQDVTGGGVPGHHVPGGQTSPPALFCG